MKAYWSRTEVYWKWLPPRLSASKNGSGSGEGVGCETWNAMLALTRAQGAKWSGNASITIIKWQTWGARIACVRKSVKLELRRCKYLWICLYATETFALETSTWVQNCDAGDIERQGGSWSIVVWRAATVSGPRYERFGVKHSSMAERTHFRTSLIHVA